MTRLYPWLFAAMVSLTGPISSAQGPSAFFEAAKDPVLQAALYSDPQRLVTGKIAADGADDGNSAWAAGTTEKWNIERQRYGGDLIQAGLCAQKQDVVDEGIRALQWGFDQERGNGSFPHTMGGNHSVSLFLEGATRGTLLLKTADPDRYSSVVRQFSEKLRRAIKHILAPDEVEKLIAQDRGFTHRRYIMATALANGAELLDDPALASRAADFARDGLSLQRPDGVNPEQGGFDFSYQCSGLQLAARYYFLCRDDSMRSAIRAMLDKGLRRVMSQVDQSGAMDITGSTRTGVERSDHGRGKVKGIDTRSVIHAFVFGAQITGNEQFRATARAIAVHRGWMSG